VIRASVSQPGQQLLADAADHALTALVKESAIAEHRARGGGPAKERIALDQTDRSAAASGPDRRADATAAATDHNNVIALLWSAARQADLQRRYQRTDAPNGGNPDRGLCSGRT
jgi:hypothetical protein